MSELLQVVYIVLVSCKVQAKVFPGELLEFIQVDIVTQVVTSECHHLFITVLVKLLENFLKFLGPLKDIWIIRLNILCVLSITIKCASSLAHFTTSVAQCLPGQPAPPFNQVHLILQRPLVMEGNLVGLEFLLLAKATKFRRLVNLLRLLVGVS